MDNFNLYSNRFLLHLQRRQGFDFPLLIKEPAEAPGGLPPTSAQIAELHNEYAITARLASVSGVRRIVNKEGSEIRPILLLQYIEGQTLRECIASGAMNIREQLQIAIELANILDRVHAQKVIHRDIGSHNVLIAKDGTVYLIDFGIASGMGEDRIERTNAVALESASLPYISPEQTGRVNRPVDYRTDLYSMGIMLYELFTGQLPFQSSDPLEVVHSHIARSPVPPAETDGNIPSPVSDIILKLMAKNAEDRYQIARSLHADLARCLEQYETAGYIEPFVLGQNETFERLEIPAKLYGREAEMAQLLVTFEQTKQGKSELLLIAGYSGVGKTALVHELQQPVANTGGHFIEGKFDQYQRNIPFSGWGQALGSLVDHWLTESETRLAEWKANILEAVGQNGQVLIDLIPGLEHIIGPQPAVPELTGYAVQNRFSYLLRRFVNAVSSGSHPLVVFLDDLQWIDPASLKLFETLLSDPNSQHLLLIGAYRNNEVGATHPLSLEVDRLENTGLPINQLTIDNLKLEDINMLLADSLRMSPKQCAPLSRLITAKTDGNAFFTRQLLHSLVENGTLSFDREMGRWQWDIKLVELLDISENVVELIVDNIQRLSASSQRALQVAACLGTRFDVEILSLVLDQLSEETQRWLRSCSEMGLIVQLNDHGRFVHDQIQQAAYALIPDQEKSCLHRYIGQRLLAKMSDRTNNEHLFEIVDHLNKGAGLIEGATEQLELAELNSSAAEAALRATAYAAALDYAQTGIRLLGDAGWHRHYRRMLHLHLVAAEAAYLSAKYELSERYIEAVTNSARSEIDRASACLIQIRSYHTQFRLQEALELGLSALRKLGVSLEESSAPIVKIETLRKLPDMTDPRGLVAVQILAACEPAADVARSDLKPILALTALELTISYGLTPAGCFSIVLFATLFVLKDDIEAAYELGSLGLQLMDRYADKSLLPQTKALFDARILPWVRHLADVKTSVHEGVQTSLESGDKDFACTNLIHEIFLAILTDPQLGQAQEEMERSLRLLEMLRDQFKSFNAYQSIQYVVQLRGLADDPTRFSGPYFDETVDLDTARTGNLKHVPLYYHNLKSRLFFHLGDYASAYAHTRQADSYLSLEISHFTTYQVPFYQALALLQFSERQPEHFERLHENVSRLRLWAQHAPMNFQHKLDIVLAERERVAGKVGQAISHYEQAIAGAKRNGFLQDEALANELYGRFWYARGNEEIAQLYLREGHALYRRWGAGAIVAYLEEQFPQWLRTDTVPPDLSTETRKGVPDDLHDLDLYAAWKMVEVIASKLDLEALLRTMITIVLENAGAQHAALIVERDGQWIVAAEGDSTTNEVRTLKDLQVIDRDGAGRQDASLVQHHISVGIVRYVARTQEIVLLDNAATDKQFGNDPSIRNRQVKSLLCIPLMHLGHLSGILYLENNLASHSFVPARVDLLKMLSSQMAISIDHAMLYERLEDEVVKRTHELNSAEKQIRSLFETSPIGISLTTRDGKVIAANQALHRMTGYAEKEMLRRPVSDFYADPRQRDELLKALAKSRSASQPGVELKRKDGTLFYADLNVSIILQDEQEILLAMIEDVTERKKMEAKIGEAAATAERNRLARELHDSVTQTLYSLDLFANASQQALAAGRTDRAAEHARQIRSLSQSALSDMRLLLFELRPPVLEDVGLAGALQLRLDTVENRSGLHTEFQANLNYPLPKAVETELYAIALEALNNTLKHAQADRIVLALANDGQRCSLLFQDDGIGFDVGSIAQGGGLGIRNMYERAKQCNGKLTIESTPGSGVTIRLEATL